MRKRNVKQTVATAILGLSLVLVPVSGRGDFDENEAIVGAAVSAGVLAALCWAVAAAAGPTAADDEYARRGWQLGVAGRYAFEAFRDTSDAKSDLEALFGAPASLSSDDSFGISGRLGYRCHRHLSVEAEAEWISSFDTDASVAGTGKVFEADIEPVVITSNIKGLILTGRYQPYLLAGIGLMTVRADVSDTLGLGFSDPDRETDFAARFGGGIDFYATKHIVVAVEVDYVLPWGSVGDLDYVSVGLGLEYRF